MDLRRLYSSPIAEPAADTSVACCASGGCQSGSSLGSPSYQRPKLPGLWSSFKAKLNFTTSRSSTALSSLAEQTGCATLPDAKAGAYSPSPVGSAPNGGQRLFAQVESPPTQGWQAGASAFKAVASPVPSPTTVQQATTLFSSGGLGSEPSSASSSAHGGQHFHRGPSAGPSPYCAQSGGPLMHGAQCSGVGPGVEAPPQPLCKLLAVSPALPPLMARTHWSLNDYIISKRMYKGSSSAVYKATCRRSGMPVALKCYFMSKVPSNTLHMLKREIEIQSALVHKNIARQYGAFMDEFERVVLVQEWAANGDLFGILNKLGGRMAAEQVADAVMRPFLEALAFLHARGICHRDIKPENILYTAEWKLKLADFGVAINLLEERAVTRAGTEGYMAPEVERCPLKTLPEENKDKPHIAYSTAVDIWAAGVLAYELMVGFPPVVMPAPTKPAASNNHSLDTEMNGFVKSQMTAAALHFPASVPQAARSFVLAALAADPAERPTASQLLLHRWLQGRAMVPVDEAAATATPVQVGKVAAAAATGWQAGATTPAAGMGTGGVGGVVQGSGPLTISQGLLCIVAPQTGQTSATDAC